LGAASDGDSRALTVFYFISGAERGLSGSVIEIQTFLVTLIQKFNISQADHQP